MTVPIWILLIAAGLDLFLPEPPTALHPVGWMGKWIGAISSETISNKIPRKPPYQPQLGSTCKETPIDKQRLLNQD